MRISDWSSDVCSSDLAGLRQAQHVATLQQGGNGLRLDRRRGGVVGRGEGAQQALGEAQVGEAGSGGVGERRVSSLALGRGNGRTVVPEQSPSAPGAAAVSACAYAGYRVTVIHPPLEQPAFV